MPDYTQNYNLVKPKKEENYDIDDVTNKNMDVLDGVLYGKIDKTPGKGLSTNDFTDGYKNKVDNFTGPINFIGVVETFEDLPSVASQGDIYNVSSENTNYIYNGESFIPYSSNIDISKLELKNHLYSLIIEISSSVITLPAYYEVGVDVLTVYINGERLIKASTSDEEGHYYEVGEEGVISNTIRLTSDWIAEEGDVFEFIIKGEYSNDTSE